MLYPIKLRPVFKDYLWGGTKLKKIFKGTTGMEKVAESWVLSAHPDGVTLIENGEHRDAGLDDYLKKEGREVIGPDAEAGRLPLLCKWIDAIGNLSVQVHPDDAYAFSHEGQKGKKEAWYVVDCEPDSTLYYGFKHSLSREAFKRKARDGSIIEALNQVMARPGDVFFIDSGIVHAIGKGMTVVEIGSNCNLTYRIYDYLRKDNRGKFRDLHIEKAADVVCLAAQPEQFSLDSDVFDCEDFIIRKIVLSGVFEMEADTKSFHSLICLEGRSMLRFEGAELTMERGDSFFLPAGMGKYVLEGNALILKTTV